MKRALRGARCLRGRRPSSLGFGRRCGGGIAAQFIQPVEVNKLSMFRTLSLSFDVLEIMDESKDEDEDGT